MTTAHGTPAGYQQHMRAVRTPCDACLIANQRYTMAWRIRSGRTTTLNISIDLLRLLADRADSDQLLIDAYGYEVAAAILGRRPQ